MIYSAGSTFLLFLAVYFALSNPCGIGAFSISHLLFGAAVIGCFYFGMAQKGIRKAWGVLLVLSLVLFAHLRIGFPQAGDFWRAYGNWLMQGTQTNPDWNVWYWLLQVLWIALATCGIWSLLERISALFWVCSVGLPIAFLGAGFFSYRLPGWGSAFTLAFLLYLWAHIARKYWKKSGDKENPGKRQKQFLLTLLPVFFVYALFIGVMPKPNEPYSWKITNRFIYLAQERLQGVEVGFEKWMTRLHWKKAFAYNEVFDSLEQSGDLEGNVSKSPDVMLEVEGLDDLEGAVYLRAKVFQSFDGRTWGEAVSVSDQDLLMNVAEMDYAIQRVTAYAQDYWQSRKIRVYYKRFYSDTILLPNCSIEVPEVSKARGSEVYDYGTEYEVTFKELNKDHPLFSQLLDENQEEEKETYETTIPVSAGVQAWKEQVLQKAKEQGGNVESGYSRLKCFERELSGYSYTLSPGEIPPEVDSKEEFLDYFLLETRAGYCMHYATAFALLAQSEGYPARVCQGFFVPVNGRETVEVTAGMAHAWPEVYLEGLGWIAFEPTPSFGERTVSSWAFRKTYSEMNQGNQNWDEYLQMQEERKKEERQQQELLEAQKKEQELAKTKERRKEQLRKLISAVFDFSVALLIGILVFCISAFAVYAIYLERKVRRWKKQTPREKLITLFGRNETLWAILGRKRAEGETLMEFGERLKEANLPGEAGIRRMNQCSYSRDEVRTEHLEELFADHGALLEQIRLQKKRRIFCRIEKRMISLFYRSRE